MKHEEAVRTLAAERYILNELPEVEREGFEEHFFDCAECADDIRVLSQLQDGTKAALRHRSLGDTRNARTWSESWTLWWFRPGAFATIGALAVTVSFTIWQNLELRRQTAPQQVASLMLHPESRGEAPEIDVSRAGAFILMEADLPGASGHLRWQVRRTGEMRTIAEKVGVAPAPGSSLKILLPAEPIMPGAYELIVSTADGARTWKFRFNAART